MSKIASVVLLGYGYWGKKLARVFNELGVLSAICDPDPKREKEARHDYNVPVCAEVGHISYDALAIATPPETHYELVKAALMDGKHVFVEKPLAQTYSEAKELEQLAAERKLKLQVGHIYLFNAGLMAIPKLEPPFELRMRFLNMSAAPSESTQDLFFAALPHAASILFHFFPPRWCAQKFDIVYAKHELCIVIKLSDGTTALIDVGDFAGVRARTVQITKDDHCYLFDAGQPSQYRMYSLQGRISSDEHIVSIADAEEPLKAECEAFITRGLNNDNLGSKVAKFIDYIRIRCREFSSDL